MIHPQALVDAGAELGRNVHVGPFSVVGPGVVIGDDSWIGPHVVLNGPTRIGRENKIFQFASLGDAPQHTGYKGDPTQLEIGDNNVIREYCTFNRGTLEGRGVTRLGNNNFIMAYCHVAHDCVIGDHTVFANGTSLAGHVTVGNFAVLGGFTLVHQYCRLGAHCLTAVATVLFKDVPPFVVAAGYGGEPHGINLRGLKRRGFSDTAVASLRKAYKTLYKSGYKLNEAVAEIEHLGKAGPELSLLAAFVKESGRGIIR